MKILDIIPPSLFVLTSLGCGKLDLTPEGKTRTSQPTTQDSSTNSASTTGSSCEIVDTDAGADITCGEDTVSVYDGISGIDGQDGVDGVSPTPESQLLYYGSVCNNLSILGLQAGLRFIAYQAAVIVLTSEYSTIWTAAAGARYCKVKLNSDGLFGVQYAP